MLSFSQIFQPYPSGWCIECRPSCLGFSRCSVRLELLSRKLTTPFLEFVPQRAVRTEAASREQGLGHGGVGVLVASL